MSDPAELQQIYRAAVKRRQKARDKHKKRQNGSADGNIGSSKESEEYNKYHHHTQKDRQDSWNNNESGKTATWSNDVDGNTGGPSRNSSSKSWHHEKRSSSSSTYHNSDQRQTSSLSRAQDPPYKSQFNDSHRNSNDRDRNWSSRDRDRFRHRRNNDWQGGNAGGFKNDR